MDKFNLTFNGTIIAGENAAEVKLRFAKALGIDDRERVELFFSGKTFTLRKNVDKSTAETFYTSMHRVGVLLKLEAIHDDGQTTHQDHIDQSWPVRSAPPPKKKPPTSTIAKQGNAVAFAEEQARRKALDTLAQLEIKKAAKEKTEELRAVAAERRAAKAAKAIALKQEKKRQALKERAALRAEEDALEQAALQRAAEGTARLETLAKKTDKGRLHPKQPATSRNKTRARGPNLFSLKPFRNTSKIRQRGETSLQLMKFLYITCAATAVALLILSAKYLSLPEPSVLISSASSIVVNQQSGLTLIAGEHLYTLDRSGIDISSFQLSSFGLSPATTLLGYNSNDRLLLQEQVPLDTENTEWNIQSCDIETTQCTPFATDFAEGFISAWDINRRTEEIFMAIPASNILVKMSGDGAILAQAEIILPARAVLQIHDGLLYMNSASGPAISIFRPDNDGFGEQLDEILLLPPPAMEREQSQVDDFVWSGGNWWVTMVNPDTGTADIYRFDPNWKYLAKIVLDGNSYPIKIVSWATKTLVLDRHQLPIQRFNSSGDMEVPLVPVALRDDIESKQNTSRNTQKLWHSSLALLLLAVIGSGSIGRLQQLRALVYKQDKVRGAEPIDDMASHIQWVDTTENLNVYFKNVASFYSVVCLSALTLSLALGVHSSGVLTIAIVLAGPAIALTLLWSSPKGHVGTVQNRLVLVDHGNRYHLGSGSRVHYRNNFLIIDDIILFIGMRQLPIFNRQQLANTIVPMAMTGVKVDQNTVIIKMFQSGHPLAKGLLAIAACLVLAIGCFVLV